MATIIDDILSLAYEDIYAEKEKFDHKKLQERMIQFGIECKCERYKLEDHNSERGTFLGYCLEQLASMMLELLSIEKRLVLCHKSHLVEHWDEMCVLQKRVGVLFHQTVELRAEYDDYITRGFAKSATKR